MSWRGEKNYNLSWRGVKNARKHPIDADGGGERADDVDEEHDEDGGVFLLEGLDDPEEDVVPGRAGEGVDVLQESQIRS